MPPSRCTATDCLVLFMYMCKWKHYKDWPQVGLVQDGSSTYTWYTHQLAVGDMTMSGWKQRLNKPDSTIHPCVHHLYMEFFSPSCSGNLYMLHMLPEVQHIIDPRCQLCTCFLLHVFVTFEAWCCICIYEYVATWYFEKMHLSDFGSGHIPFW